jgi:hypothetical protein
MIDTRLNDLGKACGYAEISAEALAVIRKCERGEEISVEEIGYLRSMLEIVEDRSIRDVFFRLITTIHPSPEDIATARAATKDVLQQSLGIVGSLSRC